VQAPMGDRSAGRRDEGSWRSPGEARPCCRVPIRARCCQARGAIQELPARRNDRWRRGFGEPFGVRPRPGRPERRAAFDGSAARAEHRVAWSVSRGGARGRRQPNFAELVRRSPAFREPAARSLIAAMDCALHLPYRASPCTFPIVLRPARGEPPCRGPPFPPSTTVTRSIHGDHGPSRRGLRTRRQGGRSRVGPARDRVDPRHHPRPRPRRPAHVALRERGGRAVRREAAVARHDLQERGRTHRPRWRQVGHHRRSEEDQVGGALPRDGPLPRAHRRALHHRRGRRHLARRIIEYRPSCATKYVSGLSRGIQGRQLADPSPGTPPTACYLRHQGRRTRPRVRRRRLSRGAARSPSRASGRVGSDLVRRPRTPAGADGSRSPTATSRADAAAASTTTACHRRR
jgi:hypothetical protein